MKINSTRRGINTTVGELIATISEVAFENTTDVKEAYALTGLVLMEILKSASFKSEVVDQHILASRYLH